MSAETIASISSAMKIIFTPQQLKKILYSESALLALIAKKVFPGGKYLPLPAQIGNPQGRSRTFTTAQANVGASKFIDFQITLVNDYGVVNFSGKDMLLARGGEASFIDMKVNEIENAIDQVRRNLSISLFGDNSGKIGVVQGVNGSVVTLDNLEDIVRFEVGAPVEFLDSTGGSSATTTVSKVNRDAGSFTVAAAAGIVAGDYIYIQGDKDLAISGLAAWLPAVAPTTGDSFFSVDRSIDPQRLAGRIINGVGMPIHEAIQEGLRKTARDYGRPDLVILPYSKFTELEKVLLPHAQYDIAKSTDAVLGIKSITLTGPKGPVNVIADTDCPSNRGYVLTLDSWKLYHLMNEPIFVDEEDGLMILRSASADAYEARIKSYCQLACDAPGKNGVILL